MPPPDINGALILALFAAIVAFSIVAAWGILGWMSAVLVLAGWLVAIVGTLGLAALWP